MKKIKIIGKAKPKINIIGEAKRKITQKQFAKAIGAEPLGCPLTLGQLEQLAKALHGTSDNVYRVAGKNVCY